MFISREEIGQFTDIEVTAEEVLMAQAMIEVWVGKDEAEIEDGSDLAILGRATMFQALYLSGNSLDIALVQIGLKSQKQSENTVVFDTELFAPFMSPWAVQACKNLSWKGTRTLHTGPMIDRRPYESSWEYA